MLQIKSFTCVNFFMLVLEKYFLVSCVAIMYLVHNYVVCCNKKLAVHTNTVLVF